MLYFDIETDGLLDTVTKGHCMVIIDDSNKVFAYKPDTFIKGVKQLQDALDNGEMICGHNIINFDIPCLEKLYPWFKVTREQRKLVVDTLVLARLVHCNIADSDYALIKRGLLPNGLVGKHSLKAWGYRLGELKGTYGEKEDAWSEFSEEMLSYCVQDVTVTKKLYAYLTRIKYPEKAIELEHRVQWLMAQQQRNGFTFDVEAAKELLQKLECRYAVLNSKLVAIIPQIPDKVFVPKRDNKTKGYKAGVPIQLYKDFNPNSRQQIEWVLKNKFEYEPDNEDLYEAGRLKIDDETFTFIKTDSKASEELRELASVFEEFLMVSKRLGQLSQGNQAWFKHVQADGRIHGSVNPCGTVSYRASHSNPNVAQVPNSGSPYGEECRALFCPPKDWIEVGVDACGLELRCLAHYLYKYDGGDYANEIINGDIHTKNQKAAGLSSRNAAKTFIYCFLYGGGDKALGKKLGGTEVDGKKAKKKFLEQTPSIASLRQAIKDVLVTEVHGQIVEWKRHYLKGLDGRPLYVRGVHSALNLLLQSAGALVCKYWICTWEQKMIEAGYKHGEDFQFMAWVHDEGQVGCRTKEIAEDAIRLAQEAMRDTQAYYEFNCQLDTEGKMGANWAECH